MLLNSIFLDTSPEIVMCKQSSMLRNKDRLSRKAFINWLSRTVPLAEKMTMGPVL